MRNSKNICIIGAGFGGMHTALELEKKLRTSPGDWMIYLIDKSDFHLYTPLLYEAATGYFEEESPVCDGIIKKGVCLTIKDVKEIIGDRKITFVHKMVAGVDMEGRQIKFKDETALPYEYLVLAAGSETEYFDIPGLRENSIGLKSIDEALAIRQRILKLCHEAGERKMEHPLNIVVGGGGFTGVILATELIGFLRKLSHKHKMPFKNQTVTIVEATDKLMPGVKPKVVEITLKRLANLGITTRLSSPIVSVRHNELTVKRGERVPFDLLIWTGGVRANKLVATIPGLELDRKGRCSVNYFLQIKGRINEFALGDNALCLNDQGMPLPPTATIAQQQADAMAHNIYLAANNKPLEKYWSHFFGFVIPLGGKYAVADLKWGIIPGFWGYVIKKYLDLKYFMSVMPKRKAFSVWWKGATVFGHND